ncbi:unnamed protein product [Fructobacillus fructosus]|uniref:hypothetical protein n=1 Tax=Fructobacillus fructosus TaxID=1631 RepID=UPI002D9CD63E|nr:unnamed protein product [Fructobacillus fructosus]
MVNRAYSLLLKSEFAASTAMDVHELETNRKQFVCLDVKCKCPLTLAGKMDTDGKTYYTISNRKKQHIKDCIIAHSDIAKEQGRDFSDTLGFSQDTQESLAEVSDKSVKIKTVLPVQNPQGSRGPLSNPRKPPVTQNQTILNDLSGVVEAYHVNNLQDEREVELEIKYEQPVSYIESTNGSYRIGEIFQELRAPFDPANIINQFHYFYGKAFVNKTSNGSFFVSFANLNISFFIQVDDILKRLPWYDNLEELALQNRPGWLFCSGHLYPKKKKNGDLFYTLFGPFKSAGKYVYVPEWLNEPTINL